MRNNDTSPAEDAARWRSSKTAAIAYFFSIATSPEDASPKERDTAAPPARPASIIHTAACERLRWLQDVRLLAFLLAQREQMLIVMYK